MVEKNAKTLVKVLKQSAETFPAIRKMDKKTAEHRYLFCMELSKNNENNI